MTSYDILALGGDGIGPEVLEAGLAVARAAAARAGIRLHVREDLLHGACYEVHGTFLRDETLAAALEADALLVGAVGGPAWDAVRMPGGPEMQDGLMRLRKALDAYAGLRPARFRAALAERTPFAPGVAEGADVMVLREMCGGVMFQEPRGQERRAGERYGYDTAGYGEGAIRRIAEAGFALARSRNGALCSADKANVMESHKLWRAVVEETAADHGDVALDHLFADICAYRLASEPKRFDVILACNLLGDLLSDLAAVVAGGIGMLPSACLCAAPGGGPVKGIYEPVHGSAPDIAGRGIANPYGMIGSVAMMFEHSFGRPDIARAIEAAIDRALDAGARTPDIGGAGKSRAVARAVLDELNG